jgi:probable F420-dependent oxidoreductase
VADSSLSLGVFLPYTEIGPDPGFLREFAQTAEAIGYQRLHVADHPVRGLHEWAAAARSGDGRSTSYDPFVLFSQLAAITTRIEFVSCVLVLPLRQTLLVAKQAAEVDLLSGGRLRLGIGTGPGAPLEYATMGVDYSSRGRRQEEQVRVLRLLWEQDNVEFKGQFHDLPGVGIHPRPGRRIPVWFGGGDSHNAQTAEPTLRRMARVGDGWLPLFRPDNQAAVAARDRLFGYLRAEGRDPGSFEIEGFTRMHSRDPERWRERIAAWRAFGASNVSLRPMDLGCKKPQDFLDAISQYHAAVTG